ncbi:MAG TPA: cupin domain-containing protein [Roseiarcus sp.]
MKVKRFSEATRYAAPNHRGFMGLRLQGFEPDGPKNQRVGISHFHPRGGAGPDSSPFEKVYVSLVGSVSVGVDGVEFVLNPMDSWTVAPNEVREIVNHQNHLPTTLVVMPYPPA